MPHPLIQYLFHPTIIPHLHPHSGRMKYQNLINNEKHKLLSFILKENLVALSREHLVTPRIIVGPRDFESYLDWKFDLSSCTQLELDIEFERTYPKSRLLNVKRKLSDAENNPIETETLINPKRMSEDAFSTAMEMLRSTKKDQKKDQSEINPTGPYSIDHTKD